MQLYTCRTGPDDEAFCKRVCEKFNNGLEYYGSQIPTIDGKNFTAGQVLIREVAGEYHHGRNLNGI